MSLRRFLSIAVTTLAAASLLTFAACDDPAPAKKAKKAAVSKKAQPHPEDRLAEEVVSTVVRKVAGNRAARGVKGQGGRIRKDTRSAAKSINKAVRF